MYIRYQVPLIRWNSGAQWLQQRLAVPESFHTTVSVAVLSPASVLARRMITVESHVVVDR